MIKKIILMTKDNELLLSKNETSENIVIDKSIEVDYNGEELIIKLKNDYNNKGNVEVTDNGDILV